MKKLTFAVAAAALVSLGAVGTVAQAQPHIDAQVYLGVPPPPVVVAPPARIYAPPAPVYYAPPPPRRFYDHDHGRRWDDRHGYYRRDRDGDGVPNRYDRAPDNPYRR